MLIVPGLVLDGASWNDGTLSLNSGESVRIPKSQVRWVHTEFEDIPNPSLANLPVYLNSERSDVLFTVDLPFETGVETLVSMRAVCLTADG